MMAENLPPWVAKDIDSICRKFFWAGSDQSVRGRCMVAWKTCCRPNHLGGLGISDLRLTGIALQTRWLWLQQTDEDRAWSQLPLKVSKEVQAFFKASTFTELGDGRRTLFWEDRWIHGLSIEDIAPYIHGRVHKRVRMRQTVREGLHNRTWVRCINGGLSVSEVIEYLHLWTTLNSYELSDAPDRLVWRWTEDGRYTAKSAYSMMHVGSIKMCGHKLVWKTWAPLRIKIFLWLCNTRF